VHQPRQIYASAADRRHGRRWSGVAADRRRGRSRRHRSYWVPAAVLTVALAAGETLRSLA
jgi:hypothetical protein